MNLDLGLARMIAATDARGLAAVKSIDGNAAALLEMEKQVAKLEAENLKLRRMRGIKPGQPIPSAPKPSTAPAATAPPEPHGHLEGEAAYRKYIELCECSSWVAAERSLERYRVQKKNPVLYSQAKEHRRRVELWGSTPPPLN